jgi:hypothetical protein
MSTYYLIFYSYENNFICYLENISGECIKFTYDFKEAGYSEHKEVFNYIVSLIGIQSLHGTLKQVKSNISETDFKLLESGSFKTKILTSSEIRKWKIKKLFDE